MPKKLDQSETLVNFKEIQKKVFEQKNGTFFIGGEEVTNELRNVLREQARYIQSSNLWEIIDATVINESAELALKQSKDMENVNTAKMLYHWAHVFRNMLYVLGKD